jgi:hypothetical protein
MGSVIISSPDGYRGYAKSVNALVSLALENEPGVEWLVTGGDDVLPDPDHSAEEIARECSLYFSDHLWTYRTFQPEFDSQICASDSATFGVMQPTGDRWGADEVWAQKRWPDAPAYIDRICGSPWMGREFCRRANAGQGPLHPGFSHMFVDENLQEYAKHLGILWQRRDLIQHHNHCLRKKGATEKDIPEFLRAVNQPDHWKESKALFDRLKAERWASCMPIA